MNRLFYCLYQTLLGGVVALQLSGCFVRTFPLPLTELENEALRARIPTHSVAFNQFGIFDHLQSTTSPSLAADVLRAFRDSGTFVEVDYVENLKSRPHIVVENLEILRKDDPKTLASCRGVPLFNVLTLYLIPSSCEDTIDFVLTVYYPEQALRRTINFTFRQHTVGSFFSPLIGLLPGRTIATPAAPRYPALGAYQQLLRALLSEPHLSSTSPGTVRR